MADSTNIGNAYVTVKPKVDDSFSSEIEKHGTPAGSGFGSKFGEGLSAKAVAIGNVVANIAMGAINAVGSAIGDTLSQAISGAMNYEQLAGGVEKIFDQANIDQIMADASNAYMDLNMSANQYLEAINKTGAAFAQTMGDQRGYDTARQGMKAIADYASGTGRSIDELTEKFSLITRSTSSYQSIADQFSGILPATSKDFLEQAQAAGILSDSYTSLTEVPIDEYQAAVSAMLEKGVDDMGLLGNTANESFGTMSGSLGMLQGAWDNFLTGILRDDADMGKLFGNLLDSLAAVAQNFIPRIGTLFRRAFEELPKALGDAIMNIPSTVEPLLKQVFGDELGGKIAQALGEGLGKLSEAFGNVMAVVQEVWPTVQDVIQTAMTVIGEVISVAWPLITSIVSAAMQAVQGVVSVVWPVIEGIVSGAMDAIVMAIHAIEPIVSFVTGIFDGIKQAMVDPVETAKGLISAAIDAIKGFFEFTISWPHIPLPHFAISPAGWNIGDLVKGSIPSLSVEWYAQGGFVDGATLIGAGEAGPEMILPKSGGLMTDFAEAVASADDDEMLIRWLSRNLGRIIHDNAPTISKRDFDRLARGAVV